MIFFQKSEADDFLFTGLHDVEGVSMDDCFYKIKESPVQRFLGISGEPVLDIIIEDVYNLVAVLVRCFPDRNIRHGFILAGLLSRQTPSVLFAQSTR